MDALKKKGNDLVENLGEKKHELITKWEEKSREFIHSFLELFGRDGTLVSECEMFVYSQRNKPIVFVFSSGVTKEVSGYHPL